MKKQAIATCLTSALFATEPVEVIQYHTQPSTTVEVTTAETITPATNDPLAHVDIEVGPNKAEKVKDIKDAVVDTTANVAHDIKTGVKDTAHDIKQGAVDVAHGIKKGVTGAAHNVKEAVYDAGHSVANVAHDLKEGIVDTVKAVDELTDTDSLLEVSLGATTPATEVTTTTVPVGTPARPVTVTSANQTNVTKTPTRQVHEIKSPLHTSQRFIHKKYDGLGKIVHIDSYYDINHPDHIVKRKRSYDVIRISAIGIAAYAIYDRYFKSGGADHPLLKSLGLWFCATTISANLLFSLKKDFHRDRKNAKIDPNIKALTFGEKALAYSKKYTFDHIISNIPYFIAVAYLGKTGYENYQKTGTQQ